MHMNISDPRCHTECIRVITSGWTYQSEYIPEKLSEWIGHSRQIRVDISKSIYQIKYVTVKVSEWIYDSEGTKWMW